MVTMILKRNKPTTKIRVQAGSGPATKNIPLNKPSCTTTDRVGSDMFIIGYRVLTMFIEVSQYLTFGVIMILSCKHVDSSKQKTPPTPPTPQVLNRFSESIFIWGYYDTVMHVCRFFQTKNTRPPTHTTGLI